MPNETDISDEKLRIQLQRILNSRSFEGVERLKRFLSFIVTETIAGRGSNLKEFSVGEYAFEKGADFDPRNDPIVRVQARRLRARLARYVQEEGKNDELVITLPKGGYVPQFSRRDTSQIRRSLSAVLLERNSISVRSFENCSTDHYVTLLCKGLETDLVHTLTGVAGLLVKSAGGSEGVNADVGNDGNHAALVIGGSVQRRGTGLRLVAQIIDSASESYLWSEIFQQETGQEDFAFGEEVVATIAKRVQEGMGEYGWKRRFDKTPRSLAAHNLYLQGRHHLEQRTEDSLRLAVGAFEKSVAEDPHLSKAHAGLADAYELLGHYGVLAPVEVWAKAPSSAGTAVLLDDRCAEAHTALAHVRSTQDWDWAGAQQEFRRALELDPQNPTAHHWYAVACLAPIGRLEEAAASMQIARSLAPLSCIIARDAAMIQYYRRNFDVALEMCDQAIELNPYFSQAYWTLGFIQEQRQELTEAEAAFHRANQLAPKSPRGKGALARLLALRGKTAEAEAILAELYAMAEKRYISPFEFASIYFALGNIDTGFDWLKKAFLDRCFEVLATKVDPKFDPLRGDARFQELTDRLGLPA